MSPKRHFDFIREALRGVVNEPHGTGGAAAIKGVDVSGKTGTAQVVRMAQDFKKGRYGPDAPEVAGPCVVCRLCSL